jgi:hypothetical protein
MQPTKPHNDVLAVVLTVGFLELIRTAWISDDAAITLRCVLNLLHGYGATFNTCSVRWRIGHFLRQLPTDYEASVAQRSNLLTDVDPATAGSTSR